MAMGALSLLSVSLTWTGAVPLAVDGDAAVKGDRALGNAASTAVVVGQRRSGHCRRHCCWSRRSGRCCSLLAWEPMKASWAMAVIHSRGVSALGLAGVHGQGGIVAVIVHGLGRCPWLPRRRHCCKRPGLHRTGRPRHCCCALLPAPARFWLPSLSFMAWPSSMATAESSTSLRVLIWTGSVPVLPLRLTWLPTALSPTYWAWPLFMAFWLSAPPWIGRCRWRPRQPGHTGSDAGYGHLAGPTSYSTGLHKLAQSG